MKRIANLIGSIIIVAGVFISCSKNESYSNKKEIVFACWGDVANIKIREDVVKAFETKYPDVKVKTIHITGIAYLRKILTMIAAGKAPDVFWALPTEFKQLVERGALLDLTPYVTRDPEFQKLKKDFFPILLKGYEYKGRLYGLPKAFNPIVMYYNKDLFDRAGLKYPDKNWTINDMIAAAKKLTKKGRKGIIEQFGVVIDDPILLVLLNGGNWFNKSLTRCTLDSPETIEAVKLLEKMINKDRICPNLFEQKERKPYEMFMSGKVAMYFGGGWNVPKFVKIQTFKWGCVVPPKWKIRVTPLLYDGTVASATTKHPVEAYNFIKFYASVEGQTIASRMRLNIPVLKSVAYSKVYKIDSIADNILYSVKFGRLYPPCVIDFDRMKEIFFEELEYVWMGKKSAREACIEATKRINKILEESRRDILNK